VLRSGQADEIRTGFHFGSSLEATFPFGKKAAVNNERSLVETDSCVSFNASVARPEAPLTGLGHSGSAIRLNAGESVSYRLVTWSGGPATLFIYTLPVFAADNGDLRYEVSLDNLKPVELNTRTVGRSEAWKQGVLRNQTEKFIPIESLNPGVHVLTIKALEDDVVLDQVALNFRRQREGYLVF
jgi:hypothetical protein